MAQYSKRGRNNNRRRQGGNNNPNRSMDSQGPEVKIRGTATQIYDKYQALARDAASSGDRIRAESLMQHAEHYYRLMKSMQPEKPAEPKRDEQQGEARSDEGQDSKSETAASPDMDTGAEQPAEGETSTDADSAASDQEGDEQRPRRRRRRRRTTDEGSETSADASTGDEAPTNEAKPQLEEAAAK
ncbi:MAG: DUF4167 domain-containing protein [Pseudomonadota bacterium]